MQKFVNSRMFAWDVSMYDVSEDQPAQCHTSDINEELGVITHLFSDKTGTLTRNEMVLKMASVGGEVRNMEEPGEGLGREGISRFMMVLTVCHSVQV